MSKLNKDKTGICRGRMTEVSVAVLTLILCCFLFAVLSAFSKDPTARLVPYSLLALIVSAFISGMRSGKRHRAGSGGAPVLTATVIMSIMLICGLLGGGLSLGLILNLITYGGIFTVTAYIFEKKKKGHKRRTAR